MYGLTLMSFFVKIMMGNYETCPVITPDSFFFEGVITGHHFWRYGAVLPETDFTFRKFITCLSLVSQTNKSVLNWVVLILMDKLCLEYFWWQTDLCKCITYSQYDFVKGKHLEITFKYLNHIGTSFHCLWLWCYQWFLALNP